VEASAVLTSLYMTSDLERKTSVSLPHRDGGVVSLFGGEKEGGKDHMGRDTRALTKGASLSSIQGRCQGILISIYSQYQQFAAIKHKTQNCGLIELEVHRLLREVVLV
jgi:hypothetical protein